MESSWIISKSVVRADCKYSKLKSDTNFRTKCVTHPRFLTPFLYLFSPPNGFLFWAQFFLTCFIRQNFHQSVFFLLFSMYLYTQIPSFFMLYTHCDTTLDDPRWKAINYSKNCRENSKSVSMHDNE